MASLTNAELRTLGYRHALDGLTPQRTEPAYLSGWRLGQSALASPRPFA